VFAAVAATFSTSTALAEGQQIKQAASTTASVASAAISTETKEGCPSYGCSLLPNDIFYNKPVQQALEQIRVQTGDQPEKILGESGDSDKATLTLIGYKGGSVESQINQDRSFIINPFQGDKILLGVFDGHAKLGELVSEYTVQTLPKLLHEKLSNSLKPDQSEDEQEEIIKQCLDECFVELDQTAPAEISGGCTASVILLYKQKLFFANAGDSRSFLCVHRSSTNTTAVAYITREDKPHLPDERQRIEKMGGQVYAPQRGTSRVMYIDPITKYQNGLAMSRSIGDWDAGKLGVIPNPIVDVVDISTLLKKKFNEDAVDDVHIFAVSATDGMMDYVEPHLVAQVLVSSLVEKDGEHLFTSLEKLISIAASGWQQAKGGRYRDDIAISVSKIRSPAEPGENEFANESKEEL